MPGDLEPGAASRPTRRRLVIVHGGLFALTCITTFVAGTQLSGPFDPVGGAAFAATLMSILLFHEMGHYVVARRHGVDVSLPYFIPLPPFISLGTMGAVIRMRQPIRDRNQLIDVGAAGPLAGLAAAVPLLVLGLWLSPVAVNTSAQGVVEGNSLAYIALKFLVHGRYLPGADGADVQLHPVAFAAWVGLLITMINLIPVGQLDGGHIASGYLADRHERFSGRLHRFLLVIGGAVFTALVAEARASGWAWSDALSRALFASMPWLVWAILLAFLRRMSGGIYHPAVSGPEPTHGRRVLVGVMAIVFLLLFTPVPMRQVIVP
ncbi:MAG TPA: site-2 protease family protein [Kofleriaceae bacterium]|nr:site-2 protease family protein [Kofleriaceae bacterium]